MSEQQPKWKPHSTLGIEIQYARGVKGIHDPDEKLFTEVFSLKGERMDYDILGLPQRLWRFLIKPEAGKEQEGERQLKAMSNEALEVLRNALGNLAEVAERILNERGEARYGHLVPAEARPGLEAAKDAIVNRRRTKALPAPPKEPL